MRSLGLSASLWGRDYTLNPGMPRQKDEKDYFSQQREENEEGFPDKSPQGLEGQNMAVKDNKEILFFEGGGSVFKLLDST